MSQSVPCRCDPVTGCGHLSSWHRMIRAGVAQCLVPGCQCRETEICDCIEGMGEAIPDVDVDAEIRAMGIKL